MNHPVQTECSNGPALEILLLIASLSSEASGEPAHVREIRPLFKLLFSL